MFTSAPQKGQALIIIVAAMIGLIAITALAVDGGNAFADKRHAQSAADAAALAAALALAHEQDLQAKGLALAAYNGYTNDGVHSTVTINNPPSATDCNPADGASPYLGNDEYIQVIINSNVDTFFAPVIGIEQTHSCVESIARAQPKHPEEMFFGNAMVSLDPSGCSAFRATGDSNTILIDGGIFVNSDSTCVQGAFNQGGSSTITGPGVCVVGSSSFVLGKVPPVSHCNPVPYPPEIVFPTPSCASDATRSGSKKDGWVVTPGNIEASWLEKDTVTLETGVYCISGDATINGDLLTGNGVLLYFIDGKLHINGGVEIHLSAMNSGPYAGLLIYLPMTNGNVVILNGNSTSQFVGTILAPASDVQVNGTAGTEAYHSQIIGFTIDLPGGPDIYIDYNDGENYNADVPPMLELTR